MSRPILDHIPYVIKIGTNIPKALVFQIEIFWVEFEDFLSIVDLHWHTTPYDGNAAQTLAAKFKQTRKGLKVWSKTLSKLNRNISNCS